MYHLATASAQLGELKHRWQHRGLLASWLLGQGFPSLHRGPSQVGVEAWELNEDLVMH